MRKCESEGIPTQLYFPGEPHNATDLLTEENHASLKAELEALARMLSALIKGTDKRKD